MYIYVIRHGITDWNLARRAQGVEDIPLNEGGIRQAHGCGEQLKGLPVDYIVSSPLVRARKTAEIIGSYLQIDKVYTMDKFTERDFGKLSGLTHGEMDELRKTGEDLQVESRDAVRARCMEGMSELRRQFGDSNILLVTHGGVIRNFLRECVEEQDIPEFFINCGVCMLSYENHVLQAEVLNLSADKFMEWYKLHF